MNCKLWTEESRCKYYVLCSHWVVHSLRLCTHVSDWRPICGAKFFATCIRLRSMMCDVRFSAAIFFGGGSKISQSDNNLHWNLLQHRMYVYNNHGKTSLAANRLSDVWWLRSPTCVHSLIPCPCCDVQNMRNKQTDIGGFANYAKNVTQYKRNQRSFQERMEYIKSLFEVNRRPQNYSLIYLYPITIWG